jgi:prophage maintenance system killer protein
MVTFLGLNGDELEATDAEVVAEIIALTDETLSEAGPTERIRQRLPKRT